MKHWPTLSLSLLLTAGAAFAGGAPDWPRFEALLATPERALEWLQAQDESGWPSADRLRGARERLQLLARLGRSEQALAASSAWLSLAEGSGRPAERIAARVERGKLQLAQDRFGEARQTLLEALQLLESHRDGTARFEVLLALADVALKVGDYDISGRRLAEAEQLLPGLGDGAAARLWNARAGIAFSQRRTREALQHRLRAAEHARRSEDESLLFQCLTNLARAYLDLHDFASAIPLFTETGGLTGSRADQVINRLQLGISHFELNQFDAARGAFTAAREQAIELGSPRLEGTALGELGLTAWSGDRDAEAALQYFASAIDTMDSINDPVNAAVWLGNQAVVFRDTGRLEEALAVYLDVERRLDAMDGQQVWPSVYKGLGQVHLELGQVEPAAAALERCLDAARAGADSKRIWECEHQMGRLHAAMGDLQRSRDAFERSLQEIERIRVSLLLGRFKADFFENKLGVFQDYAAMLLELLPPAEAARAAFEVSERARARAFLDDLAEPHEGVSAAISEETLEREDQLLRQLWQLDLDRSPETAAERMALESELDRLSVAARSRLPGKQVQVQPATLQDIQAVLAEDEQMLVYWLAEPDSHLWRIDRHSVIHLDLPAAAHIESLVRGAYHQLTDPGSTPDLAPLASVLLEPARRITPLAGSLLIVPSGVLHYLPFEVLLPADGGSQPPGITTTYLPSASTLALLRGSRPLVPEPALLLIAGAEYPDHRGGSRPADTWSPGPLPWSAEEGKLVQDRFGRRASMTLMGEEALVSRIRQMPLGRFSVLHFATHGWIDAHSQAASGLLLGPEADGANGLLQVREIQRFGLAAQLVTLSACESGLGKLVTGEGMVGLTRAFLDAGAESVVASLWNVNDRATALFMDAFYRHLGRGLGRTQALERARNEIREMRGYGHPYYWAPFVLSGEGRGRVVFPMRWHRWAVAGLVLFGVVLLAWHRAQRSI